MWKSSNMIYNKNLKKAIWRNHCHCRAQETKVAASLWEWGKDFFRKISLESNSPYIPGAYFADPFPSSEKILSVTPVALKSMPTGDGSYKEQPGCWQTSAKGRLTFSSVCLQEEISWSLGLVPCAKISLLTPLIEVRSYPTFPLWFPQLRVKEPGWIEGRQRPGCWEWEEVTTHDTKAALCQLSGTPNLSGKFWKQKLFIKSESSGLDWWRGS